MKWNDTYIFINKGSCTAKKLIRFFPDWKNFISSGTIELIKLNQDKRKVESWNHNLFPPLILKSFFRKFPLPKNTLFPLIDENKVWIIQNILSMNNIPVAQPIILIKYSLFSSIIVMEKLKGITLIEAVRKGIVNPDIFFVIGQKFYKMHAIGITHGDTKWVNIIVHIDINNLISINFIDLDGAKLYKNKHCLTFEKYKAKDIARYIFDAFREEIDFTFIKSFWAGYTQAGTIHENFKEYILLHIKSIIQRHSINLSSFEIKSLIKNL